MFKFFLPRLTKKVLSESELIYASLKRNRVYTQDTLSKPNLEALEGLEHRYPPLLKTRDVAGLEQLNKESMKLGNKLFPPSPWDGWRENVEVFVIAAIMALAIRTFFSPTVQNSHRLDGTDSFRNRAHPDDSCSAQPPHPGF